MSDHWAARNAAARADLWSNAAQAGRNLVERKHQEKYDKELRIEYAAALEKAKDTGVMPEKFQGTVSADLAGGHIGVKVVALRELRKKDPGHPLVASRACQETIKTATLISYNRKNRAEGVTYAECAPDDASAEQLFKCFK